MKQELTKTHLQNMMLHYTGLVHYLIELNTLQFSCLKITNDNIKFKLVFNFMLYGCCLHLKSLLNNFTQSVCKQYLWKHLSAPI
jgi:hypothetical protein